MFTLVNKYTRNLMMATCTASFLISGISCQSTVEIAGDEHKVVSDKWNALAQYSESDIEKYDVTITARLAVNGNKQFQLTHFKLNNNENRQDINLIAPNFEHKYVCLPVCYQLIEYTDFARKGGSTLLSDFFTKHEFELFKFYGDLLLLNEKLAALNAKDSRAFKSYLKFLAHRDNSFDSIREFTEFLTDALSQPAIDRFIENPSELFSYFLKNNNIVQDKQWTNVSREQEIWSMATSESENWTGDLSENEAWSLEDTGQQTWVNEMGEQKNWSADTRETGNWSESGTEQDNWDTFGAGAEELILLSDFVLKPDSLWGSDKIPDEYVATKGEFAEESSFDEGQFSWASAKKLPINIGKNVCSYQESFFGVVTAISGNSINVNLLGQAKVINEGVVFEAKAGSLFSNDQELYFLPLSEKRMFNYSEVASCHLE